MRNSLISREIKLLLGKNKGLRSQLQNQVILYIRKGAIAFITKVKYLN
ncbi:hypothetical protein H6G96_11795 [Nostoc sp. FACHB-892]|nr:hypothetical protein [Nostoc sp. FACHB-892]MBD2726992.1 hypothetical protein [Nostoc sp. FACHB-892]